MRILLAGDWHTDIRHVRYCLEMAKDYDCEAIMQLGDFGYWPHIPGGPEYLDAMEQMAKSFRIPIYWIDGNHDDHSELQKFAFGPMEYIRNDIIYIPRGTVWEWDGVKFMGFGGAWSIDRKARTEGFDWFQDEVPSDQEIAYAAKQGTVDVLFTHDAPHGIDLVYQMSKRSRRYGKNIWQAEYVRKKIRGVVEAAQPKIVYHGHYHLRYDENLFAGYAGIQGIPVVGLDCNLTAYEGGGYPQDSWSVMDTSDKMFERSQSLALAA